MKSLILISSLVFVSSASSSSICKNPLLKASQQMIINILPDEKTIYAKTYLVGMMKQLNWNVIEERFKKADKILKIIRGE